MPKNKATYSDFELTGTVVGIVLSLRNMHRTFSSKQIHRSGQTSVLFSVVNLKKYSGNLGRTEITSPQNENNQMRSHNNSNNFKHILHL